MRIPTSFYKKITLLLLFTVVSALVLSVIPRIAQPLSYHHFADHRTMFGIPNGLNVLTSVFFLLLGFTGMVSVSQDKKINFLHRGEKLVFFLFFLGVFLTGVGSIYYHLNPNNFKLFWDRLPMTVMFTSFFCAMIIMRINHLVGYYLIWPAIIITLLCTCYWEFTEMQHLGDLRLYAWAQIYPISMSVLMFILLRSVYTEDSYLLFSFIFFAFAKLGEILDKPLFNWTHHLISGHSLKHCFAALAILCILIYLHKRKIKAAYSVQDNQLPHQ